MRYFRIILSEEEIYRHGWQCFWIIGWRAHTHGIRSSRLELMDAHPDEGGLSWLLTFKINEEA